MNRMLKHILASTVVFLSIFIFQMCASAAPSNGDEYNLRQPDGSYVKVKIYGDEFFQRVESIDGYTLTLDSKSGWICYAKLNNDSSDYVSTGIPYKGELVDKKTEISKIPKGIELTPRAIEAKVKKAKQENNIEEPLKNALNESNTSSIIQGFSQANYDTGYAYERNLMGGQNDSVETIFNSGNFIQGDIKGLTILVDFPKADGSGGDHTISVDTINDAMNKVGYCENGNNGSVRDYFYDISGGKVNYTNRVIGYYTAQNPREYYDNNNSLAGPAKLADEALSYYESLGYDFSDLTLDSRGNVLCLNILYSGFCQSGWCKGLWPSARNIAGSTYSGVKFNRFQITDICDPFHIGTTVHENGHMLCGWCDTYDHTETTNGVGEYDLMSYSGGANPPMPNPLFRSYVGWGNAVILNDYRSTTQLSVIANSNDSYLYQTNDPTEFFMIESMKKTGRRKDAPDEGLLIWHFDHISALNKFNEYGTYISCNASVEQADGNYDLENAVNTGDYGDLFHSGYIDSFTSETEVNSKMLDGTRSKLNIVNIGPVRNIMTFTYDPVLEAPKNLRVIGKNGSKVQLAWDPVQGATHYQLLADFKTSSSSYDGVNIGYLSTTSSYINMPEDCTFYVYVKAMRNNDTYVTSDPSIPVIISTDYNPPTAPQNLTYSNLQALSVELHWDHSTDNIKVDGYNIYNGTTLIGTSTSNTFKVTGLSLGSSYNFSVRAFDVNNTSTSSNVLSVTTKLATPTLGTGCFYDQNNLYMYLAWDPVEGAEQYHVYGDMKTPSGTRILDLGYYTDTFCGANLFTDCIYSFYVVATSGNMSSDPSEPFILNLDYTPPTAPQNFRYSNLTSNSVELAWDASQDNLELKRYKVLSEYGQVVSSTTTSAIVSLVPGQTYILTVIAMDTNYNESAPSNTITFTVPLQ